MAKGYVVLDGAAFPIVGEGEKEPNDSFREQLVANASAAIDAVDQMGYIDRNKVACGGHSYGAFMHAEKMKTPLLLIHGEADNNSGTYPLQSTRYFNALKGLGATVRLVMLPRESHGYRARESILHMLWEQDQWLEKYLKGD